MQSIQIVRTFQRFNFSKFQNTSNYQFLNQKRADREEREFIALGRRRGRERERETERHRERERERQRDTERERAERGERTERAKRFL